MEENKNGTIRISDEVIADIAIKAAQDVDGVAGVQQRLLENAKNIMSSRVTFVKGVLLAPSESGLELTVQISVLFGTKVQEVCAVVQREVKEAVSDMTGITVNAVNVSVVSVALPKAPAKKSTK
ncbi:MAG: Asp23/Gls24 family envelope stress response protein [Clostridia bacterium]|nr:Asp23/Gls24 family envelope stress response protein [Clostridia bacterium]